MDNYESMLDSAYKNLPESTKNKERFEVPKANIIYEGNKTIINNFSEIVKAFNREEDHFKKFLQKELAAFMEVNKGRLEVNRKLNPDFINQRILSYADAYVLCKECGKPDTVLTKEDEVNFIKCMACGAKQPIKARL